MRNKQMVMLLLEYCNATEGKMAKSRSQTRHDSSMDKRDVFTDSTPYRRLIGALIHLTNTALPNILFLVAYLSNFVLEKTKQL